MKFQKRAYKTILSQAGKIVNLTSQISPAFNDEVIHKFRSSFKKMRAISRWSGVSDVVISRYVKKIYRTAGKIRDAQLLHKGITEGENAHPGILLWLDSYLEKAENKWDNVFEKSGLVNWQKQLGEKLNEEKKEPELFFFESRIQELMQIKDAYPPKDETIHKGRKVIKDILFVYNWHEKEHIPTDACLPIKELNLLSDETGKFMDITNGVRLLGIYIEHEKDDDARCAAMRLREDWEKEKEKLREKLEVEFRWL